MSDIREWIFTFGCGQLNAGRYVRIRGSYMDARMEMLRRFGQRWAFQYASPAEAGVGKWGLIELTDDPAAGARQ